MTKRFPYYSAQKKRHHGIQKKLEDLQIWNGSNSAPLGQVTDGINIAWEYPLVRTYNRQLSMAAQCDVKRGHTMKEVHAEIREEIENIKLPEGYSFFWDSQYKDQKEAMAALTKYFPLAIIMLIIILVMLFGNFRQHLSFSLFYRCHSSVWYSDYCSQNSSLVSSV